jgi:ureidoglycolate hydrolase
MRLQIEQRIEQLRSVFGLNTPKTQALDAVVQMLEQRPFIGDEQAFEAIFVTKRRQGATTERRLKHLAGFSWVRTHDYLILDSEVSVDQLRVIRIHLDELHRIVMDMHKPWPRVILEPQRKCANSNTGS